VTCHLGSGSSLCAVAGGSSVDTTMGYTPLEGVVMATRAGSVDPGALLAVQRHCGLTVDQMEQALNHQSGLVALAGIGDMQEVLGRAGAGDDRAKLAVAVYQHRLRAAIAAMAAAMQGLDAVVFTGGIGEGSAEVRRDAAAGLAWLGLAIDRDRNQAEEGDRDISAPGARVLTLVVQAREDIEIARECRRLG
jgi:acetate kinase